MWVFKQSREPPEPPQIPDLTIQPIADKQATEPDWKVKHRIADGETAAAAEAIMTAAQDTAAETNMAQLKEAITTGDANMAENAVPWDIFKARCEPFTELEMTVAGQSGDAMIQYLPPDMRNVSFDMTSPRGLDIIQTMGANLVVQITDETRKALRESLLAASEEGIGIDRAAENLKHLIGLTSRQAGAVTRFRRNAVEMGVELGKADRMAKEYAQRLRRYRAEVIARTELLRAANEGHQEMLRQAMEQGIIDPKEAKKEWIVTPDDRLCPYCKPMSGVQVELDGEFSTPYGLMKTPPMHPQCRCTQGVVWPNEKQKTKGRI